MRTREEVFYKGRSVKCEMSSSYGTVQEICDNGAIMVLVDAPSKGGHHKEGDIVIWRNPVLLEKPPEPYKRI